MKAVGLILDELERNSVVFSTLLTDLSKEQSHWKPAPDKWSLLEVVCHLYDEEREDFRARVRHCLETPLDAMPPIDPPSWVNDRRYAEQNFDERLGAFLEERRVSMAWLKGLEAPDWSSAYQHPKFGAMSAHLFLSNWLAHDYLHMRQIIGIKFAWLKETSGEALDYAGPW